MTPRTQATQRSEQGPPKAPRRPGPARPGGKAPGVKDVATLAGVSVGSVSNVINGRGSVSPEVRKRVEDAIARLGYVPNPTAQALRRGTSPLVAVAVFDLNNPFFMEAASGMERCLREAGFVMTLSSTHASVAEEAQLLRTMARQAVRGVLLTPADSELEAAHELVAQGIPVVLFDTPDTPSDMSSIAVNDRAGASLAIEHLLALGHRRIIFVNGPAHVRQARQRLLGVRDAIAHWEKLTGTGSVALDVVSVADFTARAGREFAGEWLAARGLGAGAGGARGGDGAPGGADGDGRGPGRPGSNGAQDGDGAPAGADGDGRGPGRPGSNGAQDGRPGRTGPDGDDRHPTAVFCANDLIAFGVMSSLRDAGIRIPADVSLVGFDDIALASQTSVPLTTIRQPMEELGMAAVELLLADPRADEGDSPAIEHRSFDPQLVIRESTSAPRR